MFYQQFLLVSGLVSYLAVYFLKYNIATDLSNDQYLDTICMPMASVLSLYNNSQFYISSPNLSPDVYAVRQATFGNFYLKVQKYAENETHLKTELMDAPSYFISVPSPPYLGEWMHPHMCFI